MFEFCRKQDNKLSQILTRSKPHTRICSIAKEGNTVQPTHRIVMRDSQINGFIKQLSNVSNNFASMKK